jgi:arginyl-tRNA synthetase
MLTISLITSKLKAAFQQLDLDTNLATVKYSDRPDLCDYQCNGLLRLKNVPLVQQVADILALEISMFKSVTFVGPGFLNFVMTDGFLIDELILAKTYCPLPAKNTENIIIDFGGPNVAKPLHVGHLRSAIIGESLKRIARELGHRVTGDIHLGDWGTPMGMLIAQMADENQCAEALTADYLNQLYPSAAKRFKEDEDFASRARRATALLQVGDETNPDKAAFRKLWRKIVAASVGDIKRDFDALGVSFELWNGESDADNYVSPTEEWLIRHELLVENDGAKIVEFPGKTPMIFRKSDGAFSYAATDLATILMRREHKPDRILYVVDKRQELHFKQVFGTAEKSEMISSGSDQGWPVTALEHIGFGTVNGADGKPYKTRDGGVMRLRDFVQQAIDMATVEAGYAGQSIDDDTQKMLEQIAIGAIKFADLSNPRTSDYIFNPEESVKFVGKTGPYVQYAYARCLSILDKAKISPNALVNTFSHKAERDLTIMLSKHRYALHSAFDKRMPHILCDYVYNLAQAFSNFYAECDISHEENADIKAYRALLVRLTADTIKKSLDCLGIQVPDKMTRGTLEG